MARSNWMGSSGWSTIADPTRVLSGRVLVATAGTTQVQEDYLLTLAGTTEPFNDAHYATIMDYAFPQGVSTTTFSSGMLGLISRAMSFTGQKAQDCYIGRINVRDGKAEIVKRASGLETILASSDLAATTYSFGSLHQMRLNTFGTPADGVKILCGS